MATHLGEHGELRSAAAIKTLIIGFKCNSKMISAQNVLLVIRKSPTISGSK
jgi:hypothetical protein